MREMDNRPTECPACGNTERRDRETFLYFTCGNAMWFEDGEFDGDCTRAYDLAVSLRAAAQLTQGQGAQSKTDIPSVALEQAVSAICTEFTAEYAREWVRGLILKVVDVFRIPAPGDVGAVRETVKRIVTDRLSGVPSIGDKRYNGLIDDITAALAAIERPRHE